MGMTMRDGPDRYGAVSRFLHWAMAALLLWQFTGMIVKEILGRVPLTGFWVGTHASVGVTLWLLILLRAGWAFAQSSSRPAYQPGLIGGLARTGHIVLYALMLIVPSLAFLRLLGNGKAVRLYGVELRGATGTEIEWMTAPANLLHSTLAWTLLVLIVGHVAMVLVHRFWWRDDVAARMLSARNA